MTAMPIEWHEQCLQHSEKHHLSTLNELKSRAALAKRQRLENEFHRKQIAEAKRRGLKSFDSERLLVKKAKSR